MRKFLMICLCFGLMFLNANVYASNYDVDEEYSEEIITYQISEYDEIIKYRNASLSEQNSLQIMCGDYEMYTSNYIEDRLMDLKTKTNDELYFYGYNDDQIALLRNYNGDRLENCPEMRAVMSTLTISFSGIYHYTNLYKVKANWYWSVMPTSFTTSKNGTAVFAWAVAGSGESQLYSQYNSAS